MSPRTRQKLKTSSPSERLEQKLKRHPELESHFEAFVQIVENQDGSLEKADDAEWAILQEVRKLSRHSLTEWAQQQADRKAAEMPQLNPSASKDKKNGKLA